MAKNAMPRSYSSIAVHITFSTHERRPLLIPEQREKTHAYIGGIARNLGAQPISVGGVADHVHLLATVPPVIAVSTFIDKIKTNSSKWLGPEFAWQRGYGAFSVSPSVIPRVVKYIENQETHHAKVDFREEFLRLLQESGVEYDPRYLFL